MKGKRLLKLLGAIVLAAVIAMAFVPGCAKEAPAPAPAPEKYPNKPIQLVIPWGTGGGTDLSARTFAPYLSKELGVEVKPVNIEGGGGWVAWAQMAAWDASVDDHKIGIVNLPHVMSMYDPRTERTETIEDFGWLVNHTYDPCAWLVKGDDSRFQTLEEFLNYMTQHPDERIIMAVGSVGGDDHLAAAYAKKVLPELDYEFMHTSDKERITLLLGGEIDILGGNVGGPWPSLVEEGEMTYICVLDEEGDPRIPNIPTFKEVTGKTVTGSVARPLAVAPNLPEWKRQILIDAVQRTIEDPDYLEKCKGIGDNPVSMVGEKLMNMVKAFRDLTLEVAVWEED